MSAGRSDNPIQGQRLIRWVGLGLVLALGAVLGFVMFSEDSPTSPDSVASGSSIPISIPGVQGIALAPGFRNQVPVAVVQGKVVEAAVDSLTVEVTSIVWESDVSRNDLLSVWPVVDGPLTVSMADRELDVAAANSGDSVMVLLNHRGVEGVWLVQIVASVEGDDLKIISDSSGRVSEQLDYIAGQIGQTRYEAFVQTAADLRAFNDSVLSSGGETPRNQPPTVRAMNEFDDGATLGARTDEAWRASDPDTRDYDDAPAAVKESTTTVHIRFSVGGDFLSADAEDSVITVRDGIAVGFAFRAAIGAIEEERIPATPGQDLQIVVGSFDDLGGSIVATIPSAEWVPGGVIEVTLSGTSEEPIATWRVAATATP